MSGHHKQVGAQKTLEQILRVSAIDAHRSEVLKRFIDELQKAYVEERQTRKLKHRQVAAVAEMNPTEISHILKGRRNVTIRTLVDVLYGMGRDFVPVFPELAKKSFGQNSLGINSVTGDGIHSFADSEPKTTGKVRRVEAHAL